MTKKKDKAIRDFKLYIEYPELREELFGTNDSCECWLNTQTFLQITKN